MNPRIVITGMGVCSAIGNTLGEFADNLRGGVSGVLKHSRFFAGEPIWAGLVNDQAQATPGVDRAAQLAHHAAQAAFAQATVGIDVNLNRVALVLGTSHGGRSQIDLCLEEEEGLVSDAATGRILKVSPHFQQTEWVAERLGIHGPVSTVSTACSSGSAAILHALDLLRSGKCDFALAGGMDGFSKLTHAGFHSLGAVAEGACGPFSERVGISLGEGAAVVVLERADDASTRGAFIWSEIYGAGSSWDCYHLTEPHPCGDGLLRALEMAATQAGMGASRKLDYVNLHGTGTRANDGAETLALKRFFNDAPPPASSLKSFTGHTLGASGAMGLVASVLGMCHGFLPPTVNFEGARAGCDLDYIPNQSRAARIDNFSTQSAGFGGANLILIGGRPRSAVDANRPQPSAIKISGIGVVSAAGIGTASFRHALHAGSSGVASISRFEASDCSARFAGLVCDFHPRKLAPTLSLRRADLCFQYAAIAVAEALAESRIAERGIPPERIGLIAGTTRGAAASFESCMRSAAGGEWRKTSALHFPNLVMSSLGGYVSNMFQLRGAASTVVCGPGGGLQTVAHAFESLRWNDTQDALVVVLADELSPLFYRYLDQAGCLSKNSAASVYNPHSGGLLMGEGAAAFVLERSSDHNSGIWINGYGMTTDAITNRSADWLAQSIQQALAQAGTSPSDIDVVMGHGYGCWGRDRRELAALDQVLDKNIPLGCVMPNTGFAETASSGFSLAAAALSLRHQETYPIVGAGVDAPRLFTTSSSRRMANVLVTASSENGNNSALVVGAREKSLC